MEMEKRDGVGRKRLTLSIDDDLWDWMEFAGARPALTSGRRGIASYVNAAIRRDMERVDPKLLELYSTLRELDSESGD